MKFSFSILAPIAVMLFTACATTGAKSNNGGSGGPETAKLEALRPGLSTPEDSLVLDLLIGYQSLLTRGGNADSMDGQILRRSRDAGNQLEYMLRYGGIVDRGREGRVFTLPDGTKLSLQEVTEQLSRALLHTGANEDWKPATDRAREIQKHRTDLAALVEDANWVLALSTALEGTLPDDVKKRLRHLHESYARRDSHDAIVLQVNTLLPKVGDESLRRELKKLANRSWDRDKRAAATASMASPAAPAKTPVQTALPAIAPVPASPSSAPDKQDSTAPSPSLKETEAGIDSLSALGEYLEALRVLETVEGQADAKWIAARRQTLGNHYCEDRRNAAAASFIAARKATRDSARVQDLQQSLSALDSCLLQFPDAPVAAKVRRNRVLVQKELSR